MKQFKTAKKRLMREQRQRELVAQIRAGQPGGPSEMRAEKYGDMARHVTSPKHKRPR